MHDAEVLSDLSRWFYDGWNVQGEDKEEGHLEISTNIWTPRLPFLLEIQMAIPLLIWNRKYLSV